MNFRLRTAILALTMAVSFHAIPGGAAGGEALRIAVGARTLQPGEVMLVTVTAERAVASAAVTLFDRTVPAYAISPRRWQALVGIDLDQLPGAYTLTAEAQFEPAPLAGNAPASVAPSSAVATQSITVTAKTFRTRTLRVQPEYVNPPAELEARLTRENELVREVYAHPAAERLWQEPFLRPVPQSANSAFGTRSVFNGEARAPHTGTDFLSPAGTPIKAPNAGHVVVARELFFSGNTVIIDHGLGLFSMLAHLSRIDVREGDPIARGERVGLVGATGRVTGPHLHWAVRAGEARVNALSLVAATARPAARP